MDTERIYGNLFEDSLTAINTKNKQLYFIQKKIGYYYIIKVKSQKSYY